MTLADDGERPNYPESVAWLGRMVAAMDRQEAEQDAKRVREDRYELVVWLLVVVVAVGLIIIGQVFG